MNDQCISITLTNEQWRSVAKALRKFSSEYGADYCQGWEDEVEAVDSLETEISKVI